MPLLLLLLQWERERKQSHIRLYTVAWRHAFWFIDLKWPPCCDCCTRLDGERGSGVGVSGWRCMYAQNSRPFLGRGAPFTRSILCPEGSLLLWFGGDGWLIRPWCTKLFACAGWLTTVLVDTSRKIGSSLADCSQFAFLKGKYVCAREARALC